MLRFSIASLFSVVSLVLCPAIFGQAQSSSRAAIEPASYAYSVLYDFSSASPNPDFPTGPLIQASDGNSYGITDGGGSYDPQVCESTLGCGTVFQLTPEGSLHIIYSFCKLTDCQDGAGPLSLIEGSDGNLYGTTIAGGNTDSTCPYGAYGCGTAFKLTPKGVLTTLYAFCSQADCLDGGSPLALIEGADGNFYGTAEFGGKNDSALCDKMTEGCGTVFQLTGEGALRVLYNFCNQTNCSDGYAPTNGMVQGSDGLFYGTTTERSPQSGTVFKVGTAGEFTNLYTFCSQANCTDGAGPNALVEGSDGSFYGTAGAGGANTDECYYGGGGSGSCGTVFKITSSGTLTTIHNFCSETQCADGYAPDFDPLYLASDGYLYGNTTFGGTNESSCLNNECGTIYKISASGSYSPVYSFCAAAGCTDGSVPTEESLMQDNNGNLFGGTTDGGSSGGGGGVLYELKPSPALPAPVQLSFAASSTGAGQTITLNWSVFNAFSTTMQQCYAFVQNSATGAGMWTGPQTGALVNGVYSGSASITPTAAGTYTYALTCGGIESGFASLTVTATATPDISFTSVTHNMGSVVVGNDTTYGVQLTNNTFVAFPFALTLTTAANPKPFSYVTNCGTSVAGKAKCEIIFIYAPANGDTGTETAAWSVASHGMTFGPSDGGTLTGTVATSASLSLTTSVHNFGSEAVGGTSGAYGAVLTNSYNFPVTLSYSTSGSTADFGLSTNCGATLYAGQSCNAIFTFKPEVDGFESATYGVAARNGQAPVPIISLGTAVMGISVRGTGIE